MEIYFRISIVILISSQTVCATNDCYCLQKQVDGINSPVFFEQNPGNGQFYVAEQSGVVHIYSSDWKRDVKQLVNLTNDVHITNDPFEERGLLSIALHPDFGTNNLLFTYSIRKINHKEYAVVAKINTKEELLREDVLLAIEQQNDRRNGGQVLFGKEGYLYISIGDGGELDEKNISFAQSGASLLGKILRLDVNHKDVVNDHLQYYTVPNGNPFYGREAIRPEIYAFGARNMWRCSVDKDTGNLYCGDTGDKTTEEINFIKPGKNYGWNIFEGTTKMVTRENETIENEPPIYSYGRSEGHAVVGGYVYRGKTFPNLVGHYIFGDFVYGNLFKLDLSVNNSSAKQDFSQCSKNQCPCDSRDEAGQYLQSFSTDKEGEIYILTKQKGEILKLVPPLSSVRTCGTERHSSSFSVLILVTIVTWFCICICSY